MKKRLFLILTVCVASFLCFVPFEAYAGFLGKVGSTIFEGIMGFLGFNSDLDGWCWFCPIVRTLLEGANRIAKGIYSATKDGLLMILGVGTLFYIAFKVGAMVVKLQEVDLMQFMGEMFKILGRVIIASALLMNAPFVVGEIMTPFVAYSSEFAINVINQGESAVSNKLFKSVNKMVDYKNDANGEVSKLNSQINYWKSTEPGKEKPGDDFISPIMVNGMVSIVAKITANLVVGLAVGLVLILFSGLSSLVFPDLQSILSGGVIFMSFVCDGSVSNYQFGHSNGVCVDLAAVLGGVVGFPRDGAIYQKSMGYVCDNLLIHYDFRYFGGIGFAIAGLYVAERR